MCDEREPDRDTRSDDEQALEEIRRLFARYRQVARHGAVAAAMDAIDPHPASRSRLIRDLAIRGAQAERDTRQRRHDATDHLLSIASGDTDYDFDAAREMHAERETDRLIVEAYTRQPPEDVWNERAARQTIAAEPWVNRDEL